MERKNKNMVPSDETVLVDVSYFRDNHEMIEAGDVDFRFRTRAIREFLKTWGRYKKKDIIKCLEELIKKVEALDDDNLGGKTEKVK